MITLAICMVLTSPLTISEPAVVDFDCGDSHGAVVVEPWRDAAIYLLADNITLLNARTQGGQRAIRLDGDNITIRRAVIAGCTKAGIDTPRTGTTGVVIEDVEVSDCGNGVMMYTKDSATHVNLRIENIRCYRITGNVDGHCVGVQSISYSYIGHIFADTTQSDAVAVYWWNGTHCMIGNTVEHVTAFNTSWAVSMGGNNGDGQCRYDNTIRYVYGNVYLKGNRAPAGKNSLIAYGLYSEKIRLNGAGECWPDIGLHNIRGTILDDRKDC